MRTLGVDIELGINFYLVCFLDFDTGDKLALLYNEDSDFDRQRLFRLMKNNRTVGYNSMNFDLPLITMMINGASTKQLYEAANRIIHGSIKWFQVERELGIRIPKFDHIDLFEPVPAVMQSLKVLNGRLHGRHMQEMQWEDGKLWSKSEIVEMTGYCFNDDEATKIVYSALEEPLALRRELSAIHEMDFRSKSDSQIGEAIVKKSVEKILGRRAERVSVKPGQSFKYPVPDWMTFETPMLKTVLETIRNTDFRVKSDGKVDFPKAFSAFDLSIGRSKYTLGIGGLHSTEANRSVHSSASRILIDADVNSYYPSAILSLGLYPQALGPEFLRVYRSIVTDRLAAKACAKEIKKQLDDIKANGDPNNQKARLEKELLHQEVIDKGAKIQLNGVFGKLGSRYSILYAPHLLISVTLTGQLALLMLIERAEAAGISVVSGNTDGVVFDCPRDLVGNVEKERLTGGKLKEITDWWERTTGFTLEFNEYKSLYNQSVNSYIAIKADGKPKLKGPIANPWSGKYDKPDLRAQMSKNPQMTIISDAVLELILHGTPIEQTILGCEDVRSFVTVVNAAGGATWGGTPLTKKRTITDNATFCDEVEEITGFEGETYLGKVVRYYWAKDGLPIYKVKPHPTTGNRPKVPKTDGCRPIMTLPDDYAVPEDLDYSRYISEAYDVLKEIGYHGQPDLPPWHKMLMSIIGAT